MSHYAVIAPALYSHFQALQALAGVLIDRGHRVTFIHQQEARTLVSDARIGFEPVGLRTHPAGSLVRSHHLAANPTGVNSSGLSVRRLIADMAATTDMLCRELPDALERLDVDGVIADQMEAAGGLVAEAMALPFVSVACALPINREPALPLPVMPFRYATDERARRMYATSEAIYDRLMRPHARVIAHHASTFGLSHRTGLHECLSPLAQISQTPATLDFPRYRLPTNFHAVGPLRRTKGDTETTRDAWPTDPGRPFVFASLGTLQGHRYGLFKTIARACRRLDVQLAIAHCGGLPPARAEALKAHGATFVTDFADQHATLRQAQAVITHGGLNTVVDAIATSTPMLVMPIAFDQPGVAARLVWHGLGQRVSRRSGSARLARALETLLADDACRQRLADAAILLRQAGGAERAADIVELALGPAPMKVAS